MNKIIKNYENFYEKKIKQVNKKFLFPSEWLGRIIFGQLTGIKKIKNETVLDYSCGYGRNLNLLKQTFKSVYASEISNKIVNNLKNADHVKKLKIKLFVARAGVNKIKIFFDCIVCCNSIYYTKSIKTHIKEIKSFKTRLKNDGVLIFNVPSKNHYLIKTGRPKSSNSMLVTKDPMKLRNNVQNFIYFKSAKEVKKFYERYFSKVNVFKSLISLNNNINEDFYILVCSN